MRNFVSLIIGIVFTALSGSAWAEFNIKQVDPSVVRIHHVAPDRVEAIPWPTLSSAPYRRGTPQCYEVSRN